MAEQNVLATNIRQVKREMCNKRKTIVVHTDEACKRVRPHKSKRMGIIFGIELRGQVHANNRVTVR
jgi:hypothetical protein